MGSFSSLRMTRHMLRIMRPAECRPDACSCPYSSVCLSFGLAACTCKSDDMINMLPGKACGRAQSAYLEAEKSNGGRCDRLSTELQATFGRKVCFADSFTTYA